MTDHLTLSKERTRVSATTIEIALTGKTLYLTDVGRWISSTFYEPVIAKWGEIHIQSGGIAGIAKVSPFTFEVRNKGLGFQAAGDRFADLFDDYEFMGKTITVKHWYQEGASWYSRTIFKGDLDKPQFKQGQIELTAKCSDSYDAPFPPSVFRKEDTGLSRLPDASVGVPIPVIYGDWTSQYGITCADGPEGIENVGITRGVVPGILIDDYDGTTKSHIYRVTSHAVHTSEVTESDKVFLYEPEIDTLCSLEEGLSSIVNGASGVDIKLARPIYAEAFMKPGECPSGAIFTNPENATDRKEETYTEFDYSNDHNFVFIMEPQADLGQIVSAKVAALCKVTTGTGDAAKYLEIGLYDNYPGSSEHSSYTANTPWANPAYVSRAVTNFANVNNWNLMDAGGTAIHIFLRFSDGAVAGVCRVYQICMTFKYRPKALKGESEVQGIRAKRRSERHMWSQ